MTRPPAKVAPGEVPRLYFELARLGARAEGQQVPWHLGRPSPEEMLVLASDSSRQDPRLLWVLVDLLARAYDRFHPLRLRRAAANGRFPAALGVAFEFAKQARPSQELSDLADFVTKRLPRARRELLHRDARPGRGAREARGRGVPRRVQALGLPVARGADCEGARLVGARAPRRRRTDERAPPCGGLQGELSLADYLAALGERASVRQASRDLANASFLKKTGTTRGARYRLSKGR